MCMSGEPLSALFSCYELLVHFAPRSIARGSVTSFYEGTTKQKPALLCQRSLMA